MSYIYWQAIDEEPWMQRVYIEPRKDHLMPAGLFNTFASLKRYLIQMEELSCERNVKELEEQVTVLKRRIAGEKRAAESHIKRLKALQLKDVNS